MEGRFPQPCAFRYRNDKHIQAIGIQPEVAPAWQSMSLLERWELGGITAPSSWLDLSKDSLAMARKDLLHWLDAKYKLTNKNCRFQRGPDLSRHLLQDLQKASRTLSMDRGKAHPILFVDLTCWSGDSL